MNSNSPVLGAVRQPPWYAQRWPWLLMLGPATVVVAGAFTTWLAIRTPDALVVGDYYKQGTAINQDLKRDRVASGMRLSLDMRYDAEEGRLEGTLQSFGQPLAAPFTLRLAHPTLPERDLVLEAKPDAAGHFSVLLPALDRAHWQVVAEDAHRAWRLERSWDWPKHAELAIKADKL